MQFSLKNTLTDVFSSKYCKILMKICFNRHLQTAACDMLWFYWDRWDPHLKTMWPFKNNSRDQIFWKTNISYPLPDTLTYVCISGVRNVGAMVNPQCTLYFRRTLFLTAYVITLSSRDFQILIHRYKWCNHLNLTWL